MKKIIVIGLFALGMCFLTSCNVQSTSTPEQKKPEYPKFSYSVGIYVPDSVKTKMTNFITETVRAATAGMKTDDYEDTDDLVEETTRNAEKIYSINTEGLDVVTSEGGYSVFIPLAELSIEQRKIFEKLKKTALN